MDKLIQIDLNTESARRILARLPGEYDRQLREFLNEGADALLDEARRYPPELPNQEYERTFDLRRSWARSGLEQRMSLSGGMETVVRVTSDPNRAPYNRYVMDEADQARIHVGRWNTIQSLGAGAQIWLQNLFEERVRSVRR